MFDYDDDPVSDNYKDIETTNDRWAVEHGYRHLRCPQCGWSGMTDGDQPECGCYDEDSEEENRCTECDEAEDNCTCS